MSEQSLINVGIIGGSGYVALELMRILSAHPRARISHATSRSHKGKKISDVHRSLEGVVSAQFREFKASDFDNLDVAFIAVPHTESMSIVLELTKLSSFGNKKLKIIDLGTDFRLPKVEFEKTFGVPHTAVELIGQSVYGVPEIDKAAVAKAALLANPGCFAHCTMLGLYPLAAKGLLQNPVHVAAVTGSSGSGALATQKTHHPERNDSFAAYSILSHRHVPEIEGTLKKAAGGEVPVSIKLVPISGPLSRGIFATSFVTLNDETIDVASLYEVFARENSFIRIRKETPRVIDVRGSNFCDISVCQKGKDVVVVSTIDNLVKGASGNAIQCMNLMLGLEETTGLLTAPLTP